MMMMRWIATLAGRLGLIPAPALMVRRSLDMPSREDIEPTDAVVVGDRRQPKWATFACPCGCGETLLLSLSQNRRPRWSVTADWLGRPSISPSVRRPDGCRAHFWVRKGSIDWCKDSGLKT